jgi:surface protein
MVLSTILKNDHGFNFPTAARRIIFTDQPAPAGAETQDMSEAQDGGVVGWMQGDTYFVSTQRPGMKVTAPADSSRLFSYLQTQSIDVAMLDTSTVTNMTAMFDGCASLTDLAGLSQWDVSHATNMNGMFFYCTALTNIDGLAQWDTHNVTDMAFMFEGCEFLAEPDVSGFDTSHVTTMTEMFRGCESLENIDALASWDVSNVETAHGMFAWCKSLTNIDGLASWDVSNVTNMGEMFSDCTALTNINALASWDTHNVTDMSFIFAFCNSLSRDSVEKFEAHHAELTAEYRAQQPYIPKVEAAGKVPDTEPER